VYFAQDPKIGQRETQSVWDEEDESNFRKWKGDRKSCGRAEREHTEGVDVRRAPRDSPRCVDDGHYQRRSADAVKADAAW